MSSVSQINSYLINSYNGMSSASAGNKNTAAAGNVRRAAVKPSSEEKALKKKSGAVSHKPTAEMLSASAGELERASSYLAGAADFSGGAPTESIMKFVDAYNRTAPAAMGSSNEAMRSAGNALVNTALSFRSALSEAGIGVNEDGTLSIDEASLKNASEDELKSLFKGNYSFSAKVMGRAERINDLTGMNINGTYAPDGKLNTYSSAMVYALLSSDV